MIVELEYDLRWRTATEVSQLDRRSPSTRDASLVATAEGIRALYIAADTFHGSLVRSNTAQVGWQQAPEALRGKVRDMLLDRLCAVCSGYACWGGLQQVRSAYTLRVKHEPKPTLASESIFRIVRLNVSIVSARLGASVPRPRHQPGPTAPFPCPHAPSSTTSSAVPGLSPSPSAGASHSR